MAVQTVIFSVVPQTPAKKRRLSKRDLGGYLGAGGIANLSSCTDATVFVLGFNLAVAAGDPIFTIAGRRYQPFTTNGPAPANAITTDFEDGGGGFLSWSNAAFVNGVAFFCQVAVSGQVYITFEADQTQWPVDCVAVSIQILPLTGKFCIMTLSSFLSPVATPGLAARFMGFSVLSAYLLRWEAFAPPLCSSVHNKYSRDTRY